MGNMAAINVNPFCKGRVSCNGGVKALVGYLESIAYGNVGQGKGGGSWHSPGHIGHTVVSDVINCEHGLIMGGWSARFAASSLVHSNVYNHCARLHLGNHFTAYKTWGSPARDQNCADNQVRFAHRTLDGIGVGDECGDSRAEYVIKGHETSLVYINNGDHGPHSHCDLGCIDPDHTTSQNSHLASVDSGDAPQEHATAALSFFQIMGTHLNRHPPGNLAHWCE